MEPDLLWLLLGVGLLVVEAFTLTLVLGMLGVGALAAAAVAFAGAPVAGQVGAFAVSSAALLLLARPPLRNALDSGDTSGRTDPRALAGRTVTVVERVDDHGGQVRLDGELWRARPYAGGPPLEIGAAVCVAAVEGATLHVYDPT